MSGVGSMGSTGHVNEEDFAQVEHTGLPQAFIGQSSEDKWVQRLEEELSDVDRDWALPQARLAVKDKNSNFGANLNPGEMDASIVGSQTDPCGIPLKSTADALINTYFTSIHPSFPIINEIDFRNEYHEYLTLLIPEKSNDRTFRTILQMVFAIGAVHAHMIQTDWTGDDRDHLRYFTRAQVLGVGIGVLNNLVFHEQVQIFGLGAMYFMVTDQLNRQVTEIPSKYLVLIARPRAWNALGLAIRSAQALGMHLQNTTPTLTDMEIEIRVRMWHSILSLEHAINVMTGRPSMVHDKDCNVPLPSLNLQEALSQKATRSAEPYTVSSLDDKGSSGPSSTFLSDRTFSLISVPPFKTPMWVVYFRYFVELQALAQQVMTRLYNPQIRMLKWSEIHGKIREMDDELVRWARSLPTPFNILEPSLDMQYEPYRVAIGVLFNSTRATINRPCLCRIDRKLSNQSSHSVEKSQESASRCVHSARAILEYLSDEPNLDKDHFGLLWWMLQHHLKRATTVLLLELAFRSVHMPSEAEDILIDAHKAIRWLRALASFSTASKRCWTNLSRLLQLAAQKIGRNASEIVTSDFLQQTSPSSHKDFDMAEPFFPSRDQAVPRAWDPMGYYGEDPRDQREPLGGLNTYELDEFGFLQNLGLSSMFPTVGEDGGPTEGEYNEATQAHELFREPTG